MKLTSLIPKNALYPDRFSTIIFSKHVEFTNFFLELSIYFYGLPKRYQKRFGNLDNPFSHKKKELVSTET